MLGFGWRRTIVAWYNKAEEDEDKEGSQRWQKNMERHERSSLV